MLTVFYQLTVGIIVFSPALLFVQFILILVPHNLHCFRWHPLPGFDCPRRHFRGRPGMVGKEGSGGGRRQARIWFAL